MTTPNNDHLTAHDTYESVRAFFEPHLQRQWGEVFRATRRSAFAAAYDTIVNADPSADGSRGPQRGVLGNCARLQSHPRRPGRLHSRSTSLPTYPDRRA